MNLSKIKIINLVVLSIICLIYQSNQAEPAFTKIKGLHSIIHPKYAHLSPLIGFSWWRTRTIENMYRFGNDNDATIKLIKELFHLQHDNVTFDTTQLGSKPARYFNATIVGTIIGVLELHKEDATDLENHLSDAIAKNFNAETIVNQAKTYLTGLQTTQKALKVEIPAANKQLKENANKSNTLSISIKQINRDKLEPIRNRIIKQQSNIVEEGKDPLEDLAKLVSLTLISAEEGKGLSQTQEKIKKMTEEVEQLNIANKAIARNIATKKIELNALGAAIHKHHVDAITLNMELKKMISLIVQAHAESVNAQYVPNMPQIILSAFLWKKANKKVEFKDYFASVAQEAHIDQLIAEYPNGWDKMKYTFDNYSKIKPAIESAANAGTIASYFAGDGYEQLTFAFAGYQFWDQPFPAFITSITTDYTLGVKYSFPNCVEASILNFIIAMLANKDKTAIDMDLLNALPNKKIEGIVINAKLRTFLKEHKNLAAMQTKANQDAWNNVVQNIAGVIYSSPVGGAIEKDKFYEIEPGIRNILTVFNHLFFGDSAKFDAKPVKERLDILCSLFSRDDFKVTWECSEYDVEETDVSKTKYEKVKSVTALTIDFTVEKANKSATFKWNLQTDHSFIPPLNQDKQWVVAQAASPVLFKELSQTTALSLFSWIIGTVELQDIFANNPLAYSFALIFMQKLQSGEQKINFINNVLVVFKDPVIIAMIQKIIRTIPDDTIYNDQIYMIIHGYGLSSLYDSLKKNISSEKNLFIKAGMYGYLPFIALKIKDGIDINGYDNNYNTALHFAAKYGHKDIVDLLLQNKAKTELRNRSDSTALHLAASAGHKEIVELLIQGKANIEATDDRKNRPLHLATRNGYKEIVELLINNKADMNALNFNRLTPFTEAVSQGNAEIVELFIKNKADVNAISGSRGGVTPLHIAVNAGHANIVDMLIKNGANIEIVDSFGNTLLHRAAREGHADIVNLLILYGAEIDALTRVNRTPLHLAAENGRKNVVELLIKKGANKEAVDNANFTPLHLAAKNGHKNAVDSLITQGANINAKDDLGQTPLHQAVKNRHKEIVELLIAKGADISIQSNFGSTAEEVAQANGYDEIVAVLEEAKKNKK